MFVIVILVHGSMRNPGLSSYFFFFCMWDKSKLTKYSQAKEINDKKKSFVQYELNKRSISSKIFKYLRKVQQHQNAVYLFV